MRASYLFLDSEAYIEVHGEDGLVVLVLHLAVVFEDRRTEEGEEGVGLDLLLDLLGWGAAGLPLPAHEGLHLDENDANKIKSWGSSHRVVDSYLDHLGSDVLAVLPLDDTTGAGGYLRAVVLKGAVGVGAVAQGVLLGQHLEGVEP